MDVRFRLLLITLVAVFAAAVWTFPTWRPYLQDTRIQEAFPGLELDLQDEFLSLPADERQALLDMRDENPDMALDMVMVAIEESKSAPESEQEMGEMESASVINSGTFIEIDALHWGEGTATIYQLPDQRQVLRFDEFSSAMGGDVYVYLSRDPEPRTAVEVGVDFLDLGRLKGNIGNQNYAIPAGIDVNRYLSVVIFCRQFNTVITTARLQ